MTVRLFVCGIIEFYKLFYLKSSAFRSLEALENNSHPVKQEVGFRPSWLYRPLRTVLGSDHQILPCSFRAITFLFPLPRHYTIVDILISIIIRILMSCPFMSGMLFITRLSAVMRLCTVRVWNELEYI